MPITGSRRTCPPCGETTASVEVDDLPAALARAESLGDRTLVPPVSLPTGTFARIPDPDGTPIVLWKPTRDGS
jgi:predicted enzyme related to lactoylglutathione lyase